MSSDENAPDGSGLVGFPIARTVNSLEFAGPTMAAEVTALLLVAILEVEVDVGSVE